eukprot:SM000233S07973  [mRNA]  locus=s233:60377:60979:- [translate_table: standard]
MAAPAARRAAAAALAPPPPPPRGTRALHGGAPRQSGYGGEPEYLHAYHMYDPQSMKNRKLKLGLFVFGGVAFGISVPIFAVVHAQSKVAT